MTTGCSSLPKVWSMCQRFISFSIYSEPEQLGSHLGHAMRKKAAQSLEQTNQPGWSALLSPEHKALAALPTWEEVLQTGWPWLTSWKILEKNQVVQHICQWIKCAGWGHHSSRGLVLSAKQPLWMRAPNSIYTQHNTDTFSCLLGPCHNYTGQRIRLL